MNSSKYFFQTLLVIVISIISFLAFKTFLPKEIFSTKNIHSDNIVVDSLMLEAIAEQSNSPVLASVNDNQIDSLSQNLTPYISESGIQFPTETFDDYKGYQYLEPLYEKLFHLENKKKENVRIAYFGDSMTDGDLIVQDFRIYLQEKFGGKGVGFVNITSESAANRGSIRHEYSNNWTTKSYMTTNKPPKPFGVNGHIFFANDSSNTAWVHYKANYTRFSKELNHPTLFYGKSSNKHGKIVYSIGTDTLVQELTPQALFNSTVLTEKSVKNLKVDFKKADSIPIYGFNFDDGEGVHVDNFSNRGNSGLPLGSFDVATMRAFHATLNYDLIVLQYGTNVLDSKSFEYAWYEKRMQKVVQHLHNCFPGVAILIVSIGDKSTKYDMEMKTDSAVIPLLTAQKQYAIRSQSGFVNLYTLMGGENSMVKWVEEQPSKATKDYTHLNYRGAKEAAKLIFTQLNDGYEIYKKIRKKQQELPTTITKDTILAKKDSIHEN